MAVTRSALKAGKGNLVPGLPQIRRRKPKAQSVLERDIRRILRHGMTRHIFSELRVGYVAHTAISHLLAEDEQQRAVAPTVNDVLWPAMLHTADAVHKYSGSEEAEELGLSAAKSPGRSMWQTFSERPEMGRQFGVFISGAGTNETLLTGQNGKAQLLTSEAHMEMP